MAAGPAKAPDPLFKGRRLVFAFTIWHASAAKVSDPTCREDGRPVTGGGRGSRRNASTARLRTRSVCP